jgi:succinate dehydrogenase / fumarate reductase cytochrome b subunit
MALSLFLLVHLLGNLSLLMNTEKFNLYAHSLESLGLLLYVAEGGLVVLFLMHILVAIRLTLQNRAARPEPYYLKKDTGRSRRTWGSSHMILTGGAILIFLVYHLIHFKYGPSDLVIRNGVEMRDLAGLVLREFRELDEVIIYLAALTLITFHLRHGFRSLFDTLGVAQSKFESFFRWFSLVYVYAVMGGFILIPLWIYFGVRP